MNILQRLKRNAGKMVSTPVTVEQIHNEIYSINGLLFEEAERKTAIISNDPETANKLFEMGFRRASNIAEPVRWTEVLNYLKEYQQEYPKYKFIDEKSVVAICDKYNLYLCSVGDFIAEIPVKNQQEILSFRVKEKHLDNYNRINWPYVHSWEKLDKEEKDGYRKQYDKCTADLNEMRVSEKLVSAWNLKIIAPESQIDMRNKIKVGHQIVAKDPIVLQPVNGGYLIVTAWGDEASDELVVNQKMN